MNNSFKKKISLLLAVVVCMAATTIAPFVFGDDLIQINTTTFPDDTFRDIISSKDFDKNLDGYLSAEERSITDMPISGKIDFDTQEIQNLRGIEYFTNLQTLHCGGIWLEELDVSALTNLRTLTCQGNLLETLDLSSNTHLEELKCFDNELTTLILPTTNSLRKLDCHSNFIESLNTVGLRNLTELNCFQNELTLLDLSNNTNLSMLNCSTNHLAAIDLSNTAITEITDYEIGDQTIDVVSTLDYDKIVVPFNHPELTDDNFRGCSLDDSLNGSCFQFDRFVVYDIADIPNGITYECYPMLENSENMTITINVLRDFYQVNFFTDDAMSERIGVRFANAGASVNAPRILEYPQCKTFDGWNNSLTDINEDINAVALWADNHHYSPVAMADDLDTITVGCVNGDSSYQVSFISIVNTKAGDDTFDDNIDVVDDGYINAKDYAVLLKTLR